MGLKRKEGHGDHPKPDNAQDTAQSKPKGCHPSSHRLSTQQKLRGLLGWESLCLSPFVSCSCRSRQVSPLIVLACRLHGFSGSQFTVVSSECQTVLRAAITLPPTTLAFLSYQVNSFSIRAGACIRLPLAIKICARHLIGVFRVVDELLLALKPEVGSLDSTRGLVKGIN